MGHEGTLKLKHTVYVSLCVTVHPVTIVTKVVYIYGYMDVTIATCSKVVYIIHLVATESATVSIEFGTSVKLETEQKESEGCLQHDSFIYSRTFIV